MELKWFKATTYSQGIGHILNLIRKELIALQPVDSPDIAWDRTTEGIKARIVTKNVEDVKSRTPDTGEVAAGGGGASSKYAGYFTVVDVPKIDGSPPTQIKIIDGANPTSLICGQTDIVANVAVATITKTKPSSVWIVGAYSGGALSISFQSSVAAPTGTVGYIKIAEIASDGTIRQLWLNNRIVFRSEYLI